MPPSPILVTAKKEEDKTPPIKASPSLPQSHSSSPKESEPNREDSNSPIEERVSSPESEPSPSPKKNQQRKQEEIPRFSRIHLLKLR
jgi:hypothetical protein